MIVKMNGEIINKDFIDQELIDRLSVLVEENQQAKELFINSSNKLGELLDNDGTEILYNGASDLINLYIEFGIVKPLELISSVL